MLIPTTPPRLRFAVLTLALILVGIPSVPTASASEGCSAYGDIGVSPTTHPLSCSFTVHCDEAPCGWTVLLGVDAQDPASYVHGEVDPPGAGCTGTVGCSRDVPVVQDDAGDMTITCSAGGIGGRTTVSCDPRPTDDSALDLLRSILHSG